MAPIICVVGISDAGKTTFLEKLIPELTLRGYRVGTIKHDVHGFNIDQPGKDTWKHAQAGSKTVVISSPNKYAIIKSVDSEPTLDEFQQLVGDSVDILLTEGFKRSDKPKIEISRREKGGELLCSERELVALVTDNHFDLKVPQFGLDDAAGVADLLERRFLKRRGPEYVTLLVDGQRVPIKSFVQDIIDRALRAMISTLHGVGDAREVVVVLRKDSGLAASLAGREDDSAEGQR